MPATASTHVADALAAMRAATRALHTEAERSGFVAELLAGGATRARYTLWLRNLYVVYERLETALRGQPAGSPLAALADPRVFRAAAIESDLAALTGGDWRALPVLAEAQRYARHVDDAAAAPGAGLIPHAYVRYLGDLNGGRVLHRVLTRAPGLDAQALRFYAFPEAPAGLERAYREALSAAGRAIGDDGAAASGAAEVFRLNIDLSEAVLAAD